MNMVKTQIQARGIHNPRVLEVFKKVPRHRFVPTTLEHLAYEDYPLPIGENQTISQPFIVAFMTDAAQIQTTDKVLEIGTGSGYQAAILAELAKQVYTIEILPKLAQKAKALLTEELHYKNIFFKTGDGSQGWPEHGPFDVILVTAAPSTIPSPLLKQLAPKGRLIIPVGTTDQRLLHITKDTKNQLHQKILLPVRFVPMTGKALKNIK